MVVMSRPVGEEGVPTTPGQVAAAPAPSGAVVVVAFILPMEPGGREMVANWLQKRSTTLRYAIEVPA